MPHVYNNGIVSIKDELNFYNILELYAWELLGAIQRSQGILNIETSNYLLYKRKSNIDTLLLVKGIKRIKVDLVEDVLIAFTWLKQYIENYCGAKLYKFRIDLTSNGMSVTYISRYGFGKNENKGKLWFELLVHKESNNAKV